MDPRTPPRNLVRAFVVLWWTVGALVLFWSVETVYHALTSGHAGHAHLVLLGGVEAVAAVLFLIPRAMRIGAVGLLLTFAIAFVGHAAQREFRGDLLVYAAAVLFVAVHGPVRVFARPSGASSSRMAAPLPGSPTFSE